MEQLQFLEYKNGRYQGRLKDGRLLCIRTEVFDVNRALFPEKELYDPDEWLPSVDGENCWIEEEGERSPL